MVQGGAAAAAAANAPAGPPPRPWYERRNTGSCGHLTAARGHKPTCPFHPDRRNKVCTKCQYRNSEAYSSGL